MSARRRPVCLVLAPVGPAWFAATLPPGMSDIFELVFVDPAGTDPEVWSIADAVRRVEAARRSAAAGPAFVFAHSANGLLAFEHAASHPGAVCGVIAVGTPPSMPLDRQVLRTYWSEHAEPERRCRFEELLAEGGAAPDGSAEQRRLYNAADAVRRWYGLTFDPTPLDELSNLDRDWVVRVLTDEAATRDWASVRRRVQAQVLLALGEFDFISPPVLWQDDDSLSHATVTVFPRSGHQPFHDEPAMFLDAVRAWLPVV